MRIAYLCADYGVPVLGGKGGSVHIQQMIRGFAALGHEVTLYCTRLGDGDLAGIPAVVVEAERPARAHEAGSQADTATSIANERLTKERGWMTRARHLGQLVLEAHQRSPFDMIYERYSLWSCAGILAARRTGIPCVVEVNAPLMGEAQTYRELAAKSEAEAIEAEVLGNADGLVVVSEALKAYAMSRGARADRIHVIPNGVDHTVFHPDVAPAPIRDLASGPVIGFVGGLKPWHGLQQLLAAFRIASSTHPECRLMIVGDGPMRGWIEGYLAGTGLADRVVLTGWVAHDALPALVTRMDIATVPYPALDAFYFSPLKLFEYMAAGRAIVASDIGQIADVVRDGETGLLVEPGNESALADALIRLIEGGALRQGMGQAARRAVARFTWAGNARRIVTIGESLKLSGSAPLRAGPLNEARPAP